MLKRSFALFFGIAIASIACAQLQAGSPWPKVHGNLQNTGVGLGSGNIGLLEWTFGTANDHFSAASISVDGTLYLGDDVFGNCCLFAVDAATGEYQWLLNVGGQIESAPTIGSDGTIYFGADDNNLYAVNSDGTLKWTYGTGGIIVGSPTIGSDGTIYFGSNDLTMHAVTDGGTQGITKWATAVGADIVSSPLIDNNGDVIVGTKGSEILTFDPQSGAIDQNFSVDGPVTTDAIWDSTTGAGFATTNDSLYLFTEGLLAYSLSYKTTTNTFYSPSLSPDLTLWLPDNTGVTAYQDEGTPGKGVNTYSFGTNSASSVVLGSDGTAYVAGDKLYSLSPNWQSSSPTVNWSYPVQANAQMAMAADGTLFVPDSVHGGMVAIGSSYILFASMDDDSVIGGEDADGTVQLALGAVNAGDSLSLSSSSPDVHIPASLPSPYLGVVHFSLDTSVVGAPETVTITASCQTASKQMTVILEPTFFRSFGFESSSVQGGSTVQAMISLDGPTGPSGDVVSLTSSSADANIPATVTVPNGSRSVFFSFPTAAVSSTEQITLTAALGPHQVQATLTLDPALVSYVRLSPTSVQGGQRTAFGVYLSGAAGSGGDVVSLSSSSTDAVIDSSLTISQGATSGSLFVHTLPVSSKELVTITATYGSSSWQSTLALLPATLTSVKVAPTAIQGGTSGAFAVYLNGEAGSSGDVVSLSSSSTDVTVPTSVTVGSGATDANVAVQTAVVSSAEQVTLSATFGSTTLHTTLTLNPLSLSGLKLQYPSVIGGSPSAVAVYLTGRAGSSGVPVSLSTSSSAASIQSSVTIPSGASSANVVVHTAPIDTAQQVTITAQYGSSTVTTTLTVTPAALNRIVVSPPTTSNSQEMLTLGVYLNGPAGPSGTVVTLTHTGTAAMANNITIPAGATAANIKVSFSTSGNITATLRSVSLQTQVTFTGGGQAPSLQR
ncbi:MAG TPA: PQQ-binding-like beta-propeller repeat protein [Fimbriimonadaceae bacterium]|jgi:hypothetical protein